MRSLLKMKAILVLFITDAVEGSLVIQMKATEQRFPVVLFIMLYKVVILWIKS